MPGELLITPILWDMVWILILAETTSPPNKNTDSTAGPVLLFQAWSVVVKICNKYLVFVNAILSLQQSENGIGILFFI